MPKYEEIREQTEARSLARKLDRQARLQDEVKPFARLERATKALQSRQKEQNENRRKQEQARRHSADANNSKQSPRKDFERTTREHMSLKERQIEEDRHRRARCDRRAQQLLRDSRLPQRMELHERQRARASQNGADERPAAPLECTFQPQVNTRVPDFAASKERWIRTLAQAKQKHKPTQPSVDHWSMFSKDAEARKERRKARAEAKQAAAEAARVQEKQRMASLVRRVQSEAARRPTTVNMTKSQEMRLRSCAEAKAKAKADQERQAKRRASLADRQRKRSSVIRAMVQDAEEQRRASTAYTSLEDAAVKARERAKQDRLVWRERRRELREKMSNPRPDRAALIEQHGERQRLQTRKQAALARVAATLHAADGGKSTSAALSQDEMDIVRETIVQEQI
ncbi:Hypothetical Protein FCC1311_093802 [Hondaea fermentalgiana]|uniref:Uncharacterized protein n=1 Tax=Hondaea fermentalgiana TaxID=2315210 RepID=A0A2R5GQJ7_9STRA|nr:Hypothetical Protein FCC1311_093802 [Hondaea fermentalgiana]|eukprot:GBG33156.1 Hypothetical Protein FCC1311_093802 [Hondaea fermentalgiana]